MANIQNEHKGLMAPSSSVCYHCQSKILDSLWYLENHNNRINEKYDWTNYSHKSDNLTQQPRVPSQNPDGLPPLLFLSRMRTEILLLFRSRLRMCKEAFACVVQLFGQVIIAERHEILVGEKGRK